MMPKGVFCDTSFFMRLLDKNDPLHANAKGYFRHFTEKEVDLFVSTIAIAEYCVGGDVSELPLRNLQIIPFNLDHSKRAGEFARIIFEAKRSGNLSVSHRNLIPNDTKLFAQADCEKSVDIYLSSDTESQRIYNLLPNPKFRFVDLNTPHHQTFGILDLE